MITLKHLMVIGARTGPGPYMQDRPRTVLLVFLTAVVAGSVAIWNRSRYHP